MSERCRGHCCRRFALKHSPEKLRAEAAAVSAGMLSEIKDVQTIADMVILVASNSGASEHVYTCKNLSAAGDCTIYDRRPQMCRDFPEAKGCHFWKCESSQSAYFGMPLWKKIFTRLRWLKELDKKNVL